MSKITPSIGTYLSSLIGGKREFEAVDTYCMFIGYPRSGHTLIGAFMDAHPDMVVSNELDALAFVKKGYSREQVYRLILRKSERFAAEDNVWQGYSYKVPGWWQGRFRNLKIIGDKRGSNSAKLLARHPELLEKVAGWAPKLKVIHMMRNPFDNITTCMRRREKKNALDFSEADLRRKIGHHFHKVKTIDRIRKMGTYDILDIRHEDFILDPSKELNKILSFLGVEAEADYLNACEKIVFSKPHKSRHETDKWSQALIQEVQERIEAVDFLKGYDFEH